MTHYRSLSHTKWTCPYHVVFLPKYRKKVIYGELRRDLGEVLRTSCPRWAATNKRFERISGSRNRKNVGKHNSGWIPVATFRWRK